jgi:hypothetical protein
MTSAVRFAGGEKNDAMVRCFAGDLGGRFGGILCFVEVRG